MGVYIKLDNDDGIERKMCFYGLISLNTQKRDCCGYENLPSAAFIGIKPFIYRLVTIANF